MRNLRPGLQRGVNPFGVYLIGQLRGANLNSTSDQPIPLYFPGTRWTCVGTSPATMGCGLFTNGAGTVASAIGGIYTGAGKTGTQIVAATISYATLTSPNILVKGSAGAGANTQTYTNTVLYFSLTTPSGAAGSCDIFIYATVLP